MLHPGSSQFVVWTKRVQRKSFANEASPASAVAIDAGGKKPRKPKCSKLDLEELRVQMNALAEAVKVHRPEDWYSRRVQSSPKFRQISTKFGLTQLELLRKAYPMHEWLPWRFRQVPRHFWVDKANQRRFMDWALENYVGNATYATESEKLSHWYKAKAREIKDFGATGLIARYGDSLFLALKTLYPQHEFLEWEFKTVPVNFWSEATGRRRFLEHVARKAGWSLEKPDQFYAITRDIIVKSGGRGLLAHFGESPPVAVMDAFPEHDWKPWKFKVTPRGWWEDKANQRRYILEALAPHVAARLGRSDFDDLTVLKHATTSDFSDSGGWGLFLQYDCSVAKAILNVLPDHGLDRLLDPKPES